MCSSARLKSFIDERTRLITAGYFLPEHATTVQHVASLVKDIDGGITQLHEETHRDLTKLSELGFFEMLIGSLIAFIDAPSSAEERSRQILQLIAEKSWMTHESAAVYCPVIEFFGNSPDKFLEYMNALPDKYKIAFYKYSDIIGSPTEGMDKLRMQALNSLARCISIAALNVPILAHFSSYAEVSQKKVALFLGQHNPDARQEELLKQLSDQKIRSHLLERAESYIKETEKNQQFSERGHRSTFEIFKETILASGRLTEAIGSELQVLLPQMVLWTPREQRLKQYQEVINTWRSEWVSRGYKNVETYNMNLELDTDNVIRSEWNLLLRRTIVQIPPGTMVFYRRDFIPTLANGIREHIEAVQAAQGDLLVSVIYRKEMKWLDFTTCPWLWHTSYTRDSIHEKFESNVSTRPHRFVRPIGDAQGIIDALADLNTVWVRWLDEVEEMARSSEKLPSFPGLSFICTARCTTEKVIEKCQQLARNVHLTVFLWTPSPRAQEARSVFLVAVLPDKATLHIFPLNCIMIGFIEETLKDTDNITWLAESKEVKALGNFDILTDIGVFFCGG